jgi:hypothetical protein
MTRAVLIACLPWLGLLAAAVVFLWGVVRLNRARPQWGRLFGLHGDQGGSVQGLSFVLSVPLFALVLFFILQISQLMIGTIVVQYAAFAAARSAIVWIPASLGPEGFNCVTQHAFLSEEGGAAPTWGPGPGGRHYKILPVGRKYEKIASAAMMAVVPICPSQRLASSLPGNWPGLRDLMMAGFHGIAPQTASGENAIKNRLTNKLAYAVAHTEVDVRFFHANAEPPLNEAWGRGPDPEEYRIGRELGWQDPITVSVRHEMAMLPGPATLFVRARRREGYYVYPLAASATLGLEGEKITTTVAPYVEYE